MNGYLGLMFRIKKLDHPIEYEVNLNATNVLVHTWFCFYPIKITFYSKEKIVLGSKIMKPFNISRIPFYTKTISEEMLDWQKS